MTEPAPKSARAAWQENLKRGMFPNQAKATELTGGKAPAVASASRPPVVPPHVAAAAASARALPQFPAAAAAAAVAAAAANAAAANVGMSGEQLPGATAALAPAILSCLQAGLPMEIIASMLFQQSRTAHALQKQMSLPGVDPTMFQQASMLASIPSIAGHDTFEAAGLLHDIARSEPAMTSASELRADTVDSAAAPKRKRKASDGAKAKRAAGGSPPLKVSAALARVKAADDGITATSPSRGDQDNTTTVAHGSDEEDEEHASVGATTEISPGTSGGGLKRSKPASSAVPEETASAETKRVKLSSADKKAVLEAASEEKKVASQAAKEPEPEDPKIEALLSMGFDREKCLWALKKRGGRVDRAAELLMGAL